jgi:hypothetical protein
MKASSLRNAVIFNAFRIAITIGICRSCLSHAKQAQRIIMAGTCTYTIQVSSDRQTLVRRDLAVARLKYLKVFPSNNQ